MRASWWQQGVIYQIYPCSFQDTDGDGVGDLKGIELRLGFYTQAIVRWGFGLSDLWLGCRRGNQWLRRYDRGDGTFAISQTLEWARRRHLLTSHAG
jgi:hypothetical protein